MAGFLNNSISLDDLRDFFGTYYPAATGRAPTIRGPNEPGSPGIEGSLDIQYIMSIGSNVSTSYVLTPGERPYPVPGGGTGENEPFLDYLLQLGATDDASLPGVVSVSYARHGQRGRLGGEAMAGHHGLHRLHLKAWVPPSALVRRGPAPQIPLGRRGPPARGRPSRRCRRVWPYRAGTPTWSTSSTRRTRGAATSSSRSSHCAA